MIHEDGEEEHSVFVCRFHIADGITHHNCLIFIVAEFQHFADAEGFASYVLCKNDIHVRCELMLLPFFFDRTAICAGNYRYVCDFVSGGKAVSCPLEGNLQFGGEVDNTCVNRIAPGESLFKAGALISCRESCGGILDGAV